MFHSDEALIHFILVLSIVQIVKQFFVGKIFKFVRLLLVLRYLHRLGICEFSFMRF